jgi:hypothetical protein
MSVGTSKMVVNEALPGRGGSITRGPARCGGVVLDSTTA